MPTFLREYAGWILLGILILGVMLGGCSTGPIDTNCKYVYHRGEATEICKEFGNG
jgi:hypothetical protein